MNSEEFATNCDTLNALYEKVEKKLAALKPKRDVWVSMTGCDRFFLGFVNLDNNWRLFVGQGGLIDGKIVIDKSMLLTHATIATRVVASRHLDKLKHQLGIVSETFYEELKDAVGTVTMWVDEN